MKNQIITSSRRVGMRDINALLQSAPISRIGCCPQGRDDEGCRGFTLIELLVVVLIIGILAAIALPQYQLAVEKSRAAEALTNISSFSKAVELWKLEHPGIDRGFTGDGIGVGQLDIDLPGDWVQGTSDMIPTGYHNNKSCSKNFCYGVNTGEVKAVRANNSTYQYTISLYLLRTGSRYFCFARTEADLKLCNSLSNMTVRDSL